MPRDPATLLTAHRVFRCADASEFHAHVASLEGFHRRQIDDDGPVEIELRQVTINDLTIGVLYANVRMTVEADRTADRTFLVQFPLSGRAVAEVDGTQLLVGPEMGLVLSPVSRVRRRAHPGWTLVLVLDRALVSARLAARLGHAPSTPLVFRPLITGAADELRDYALLLVEAVERGGLRPATTMAAVLTAGFVDLLLALQPHNHGETGSGEDTRERSERVRIVDEYLHEHLDEPLTIGGLARLAGCGTRTLQGTFAEFCGASPMQYVRQRRLKRARELLAAPAAGVSVAEVARRTGFEHLGRFAASYRATYGERPSDTLRRAAGGGQRG